MILDIAARYAWLAVPSLLALTLCIAVELISQRERYTLADRFPGVLFVLLLPVLAGIILPPLMALWNMLDVSPILDLTGLSRPLQVVVLILMYDFANYWEHRFEHRFIWSIHAVHHSPTELHGANAYGHPLQAISQFLFKAVPFSLLGLDSVAMPVLAMLAISFWTFFVHSPTRVHLGPLRWIVVDGRFHRIHHSMEERHFDHNFAPIFTIWDQLFGTAYFPSEEEHPDVGLKGVSPPRTIFDYLGKPVQIWRKRRAPVRARQDLQLRKLR